MQASDEGPLIGCELGPLRLTAGERMRPMKAPLSDWNFSGAGERNHHESSEPSALAQVLETQPEQIQQTDVLRRRVGR